MSDRAAMEQALAALESCDVNDGYKGVTQHYDEAQVEAAIAALRARLEVQQEGERTTFEAWRETATWYVVSKPDPDEDKHSDAATTFRLMNIAAHEAWQAALASQGTAPPTLNGPEFTDWGRAALLWVLWHHQGGSSPVGQPIRFALGMDAHERLNDHQIAQAKRWADSTGSTREHGSQGTAPLEQPQPDVHSTARVEAASTTPAAWTTYAHIHATGFGKSGLFVKEPGGPFCVPVFFGNAQHIPERRHDES